MKKLVGVIVVSILLCLMLSNVAYGIDLDNNIGLSYVDKVRAFLDQRLFLDKQTKMTELIRQIKQKDMEDIYNLVKSQSLNTNQIITLIDSWVNNNNTCSDGELVNGLD